MAKKRTKARKTKKRKVRRVRSVLRKRAGRKPRKGERKGQSISYGYGYYMKGGVLHKYDSKRDAKIKAKRVRKPSEAAWRGDLKGKRV